LTLQIAGGPGEERQIISKEKKELKVMLIEKSERNARRTRISKPMVRKREHGKGRSTSSLAQTFVKRKTGGRKGRASGRGV